MTTGRPRSSTPGDPARAARRTTAGRSAGADRPGSRAPRTTSVPGRGPLAAHPRPTRPSRSGRSPLALAVLAGLALTAALPATAAADPRRSVEAETFAAPAVVVADPTASEGEALRQTVGRRVRTRPTELVATSGMRVRVGGCRGRVRLGSTAGRLRTVRVRRAWQVVTVPSDPAVAAPGLRLARAAGEDACDRVLLDRVDVVAPPLPLAAALQASRMRDDARYRRAYASTFDGLTPENELKMDAARPTRDRYAFEDADALVAAAAGARRPVRGHALVYDRQLPSWLVNPFLPWTRSDLIEVLRDHVAANVQRYRGRVDRWDVLNEAVDDRGRQKSTFWSQGIGEDYADWAFRFARAADPTARLVYNDNGIERPGAHQDGVVRLLTGLQRRGVPLDGVGLQAHVDPTAPPSTKELDGTIRRFADLGLRVEITEADVPVGGAATPERVAAQTETFRRLAAACWRHAACDRVTVWGVGDGDSWKGVLASATLLDAAYRPKPALDVVRRALRGEY